MKTHVYDIRSWDRITVTRDAIVLRPGLNVLLHRLVATAIAFGIVTFLVWGYTSSYDFIRIGQYVINMENMLMFLMGLIIALGVLVPASCLWNHIRIERTPRGDIYIFHMGILLPSFRQMPSHNFKNIVPAVREVLRSSRNERHFVWWYSVTLTPTTPDGYWVEFRLVEETRSRQLYFPKIVRQFGTVLGQITGVQALGFDEKVPVAGGRHERVQITRSVPQTQKRLYTSLEEVPPGLRSRFEQLKAEADRKGRSGIFSAVTENITITEKGETRTYHSVDEMPPEMRARYEEVRRMAKGGPVPPGVSIRTEEDFFETYDG